MIRSPTASSLPAGALPSPISAMRPPVTATQPRSITRSARTILALPSTVSFPIEVISHSSLCRCGKRCHVDDPVGDQMADFIVMDNRHHGDISALLFVDQLYHHGAIGRIERGSLLVQKQDRQIGDEAAR